MKTDKTAALIRKHKLARGRQSYICPACGCTNDLAPGACCSICKLRRYKRHAVAKARTKRDRRQRLIKQRQQKTNDARSIHCVVCDAWLRRYQYCPLVRGRAAFWNAVKPAPLRDRLRVCGMIGIQPSKESVILALADAKVKVIAGDGNCFFTATALECALCVDKTIRGDSFARCRQVCLELVRRGLRGEMSIGGLLLQDVLKAATGLEIRVYLEKMQAPSMDVKSWGGCLEGPIVARYFKVPLRIWEQCVWLQMRGCNWGQWHSSGVGPCLSKCCFGGAVGWPFSRFQKRRTVQAIPGVRLATTYL